MMKRAFCLVFLGLFSQLPCFAGHTGGAPVHPASDDDDRFLTDSGPGLDTGCTFRGDGPLEITAGIDRFYGDVTSQGFLLDRRQLAAAGLIVERAILRMPAFDVDRDANIPGVRPEIDHVFVNGKFVGTLTGRNNTWVMNEFEVSLDDLRFPARGDLGVNPDPRPNVIRIDIDTANRDEVWCTAIDWVQFEIRAVRPLILVHGIAASPSTFSRLDNALESAGIPYEREIQLGKDASILRNATMLRDDYLDDIAKSFGVSALHAVGHSKGGLDLRGLLRFNSSGVDIRSLHTISTPHQGSVLASISVANRSNPDVTSADPDVEAYLELDDAVNLPVIGTQGPRGAGLRDLQVLSMVQFNSANPTVPVPLYTYGADADLNDDDVITFDEMERFLTICWIPPIPVLDRQRECERRGTLLYSILRDVSNVVAIRRTRGAFGIEWTQLLEARTPSPQLNDLAVTDTSSRFGGRHTGPLDENHSTVVDRDVGEMILEALATDFPVQ